MSLFNWFSRKSDAHGSSPAGEPSDLSASDVTVPISSPPGTSGGQNAVVATPAGASGSAVNRKGERLERREQLYGIVREAMTQAGVLSSSYKFKVLSLDSRGKQFLVMMDLPRQHAGDTARLAEIEGLIARNAKTRFEIIVTSVYWRINEHVTAGLTPRAAPVAVPTPTVPEAPRVQKSAFEPIAADEVEAFKRAISTAPTKPDLPKRRVSDVPPKFEDTQIEEVHSPLSGTQYGELR